VGVYQNGVKRANTPHFLHLNGVLDATKASFAYLTAFQVVITAFENILY
jgi:hypothetical protein